MISLNAFGKNDIRGIYKEDITEELYYYVGRAFVKYLEQQTGKEIREIWTTVCRDARTHSPSLADALIKGVRSTGANVVDLGLAPTPIGYYSEAVGVHPALTEGEAVTGALIVTASHNPSQYNGLKMTYNKQTLNEEQIKEVKALTEKEIKLCPPLAIEGALNEHDIVPDYIEDMKEKFKDLKNIINGNIKVVVDSGNGTGGILGPQLYRLLGCKVVELFSTPDGRFPNHHPNPSEPRNMIALKKAVIAENADLGIAYDGDSDRIGVVDSKGNVLTGDKLLLIYAQDVIEQYKKQGLSPIIVSEVKCSQVLFDTINSLGGQAVMCKTGHGYIKSKMKETGAVLAGEMSGHTFFKDRYYGFDDAIYAGCRIIEILANKKLEKPSFHIEDLLTVFDSIATSPELRLPCPNEFKKPVLASFEKFVTNNKDAFGDEIKDIITLDGMRIVFDGGFALVRQSNTEPVFTLRFEAKTKTSCDKYQEVMVSKLNEYISDLEKSATGV